MNLQELQLSKDLKNNQLTHKQILAKHGWTILGTGTEASVAEHPNKKYVLKLFNRNSKYKFFVDFVTQHQSNPHLPKFSQTIRSIPGNHRFYYVRMEKLLPLPSLKDNLSLGKKYFKEMLSFYVAAKLYGVRYADNEIVFRYPRTQLLGAMKLISTKSPDLFDDDLRAEAAKTLYKEHGSPSPQWIDMVDNFSKFTANLAIGLDLHQGNFMLRDQTLVMTDPM